MTTRYPDEITNKIIEQIEALRETGDLNAVRESLNSLLENVGTVLEELQVSDEELRQHNEELLAMRSLLEQQRKEFQQLFHLAPSGYVVTDEHGIIKDANEAAQRLLKKSGDALAGKALPNVVAPKERRHIRAKISEVGRSNHFLQWEQTIQPSDTEQFPAQIRAAAVKNEDGSFQYLLWLIQDISERKKIELVRENARAFREAIIQTIRHPLLVLSDELRVTFANNAFCRMFQAQKQETEGRHIYDLGNQQWDIPELRRLLEEVLLEQKVFEDFPVEQTFPHIGRKIMLLNARRLHSGGGEPMILLAIEDATERLEAQRKAKALLDQLKHSNEHLEQFAYIASHDLQEPLRMVTSYVQLLKRRYGGKLGPEADEFIEFAVDGAFRMKRLIESLLEYSRVQTRGKSPEPVDAQELLAHVLRALEHLKEETGAQITHDPLPIVKADSAQLSMVLQNLIENAIKFRSEKPPKIHVSAQEEPAQWVFSVADNGIGIEARHQDRVFRLFQRLHTRSERSGTGIGLAICKRVIDRHGGRIWFESTPGVGSTFYFTLPRGEIYDIF